MMKLLSKVSLYFIFTSLFLFVLGSAVSFFVIDSILLEEMDETLVSEKNRIVKELKDFKEPIQNRCSIHIDIKIVIEPETKKDVFSDTLIFVKEEEEDVLFRQLKTSETIDGQNIQISLRRSLIEQEDLVGAITVTMMGVFISIILLLNLINIWSDRKLWKPFYNTLDNLAKFELNRAGPLNMPRVNITEFHKLNQALNKMADKNYRDFQSLKQFSENASHEMQTPLAVIRSKLDLLVQDNQLSEKQLDNIHSLYNPIKRLSRLIQSLNLLTKINNEEYSHKEQINFNDFIQHQLDNISELLQINGIKVKTDLKVVLFAYYNHFMAETLISNLLLNAVKHNIKDGFIHIETGENYLILTNSGPVLESNPNILFERFKKGNPSSDSPGLGLSIVKEICERNNLNIQYTYENNKHCIKIDF